MIIRLSEYSDIRDRNRSDIRYPIKADLSDPNLFQTDIH